MILLLYDRFFPFLLCVFKNLVLFLKLVFYLFASRPRILLIVFVCRA